MRRVHVLAFIVFGVLSASTKAEADAILFSNLGPGGTYQTNVGWTVGMPPSNPNSAVAASFSPGVTALLTELLVPFADFGPTFGFPAGQLNLSIVADDGGGFPSTTVLESFSYLGPFGVPGNATPITLSSTLNPLLLAGLQYWVVATNPLGSSGSFLAWSFNSTGDTSATGGITLQGDVSDTYENYLVRNPDVAFEVKGNAAPVPEPSTLLLLGAGLIGAANRLRRRAFASLRSRPLSESQLTLSTRGTRDSRLLIARN